MSETFEENLRSQFDATYERCMPALDGDPQKYSFGWFKEGAFWAIKLGIQIGQEIKTEEKQRAFDSTWNVAKRQGMAQAAFLASNISLSRTYSDEVMQGAALMRELIVLQLQEAAKE